MSDVRDVMMVGRRTDGTAVQRPLSPHLQVYRLPLSGLMSIANRITGIASIAGVLLMVWWLVAAAVSERALDAADWFISSIIGMLFMLGWTAAMFYHLFSGLRHLAWDMGYGWSLPDVNKTGRAILLATIIATVVVWGAGLIGLIGS